MDRAWLEHELGAGRSIEAIAREVDRDPSTVAYWVNKHGLVSIHAEKHAARGGIAREQLEPLVAAGLSIRAIGERLGVSYATVRHWLKRHELKTRRAVEPRGSQARTVEREYPVHGLTTFGRRRDGYFRCLACRADAVVKRRRAVKGILVEEAGGACKLCGYNRVPAALQFHHLDRSQKAFELSHRGATLALDAARAEVAKCVLLCANCHAEVEAGAATVR
jgi:DNA-binding transcriptional ArsR family regulator